MSQIDSNSQPSQSKGVPGKQAQDFSTNANSQNAWLELKYAHEAPTTDTLHDDYSAIPIAQSSYKYRFSYNEDGYELALTDGSGVFWIERLDNEEIVRQAQRLKCILDLNTAGQLQDLQQLLQIGLLFDSPPT